MNRGLLQLLLLAPTHPAQQEREKNRCAFRNTVTIQLMTVHHSLDSENWLSGNRLRSSGAWACYSCLLFRFEMLELARWVRAHRAGSNTAALWGPTLVTLLSTSSLMIKTTFIAWHGTSQEVSYRKKANHAWMPVSELPRIFFAVLSHKPEFQETLLHKKQQLHFSHFVTKTSNNSRWDKACKR